jgi:hypothetical protein
MVGQQLSESRGGPAGSGAVSRKRSPASPGSGGLAAGALRRGGRYCLLR